MPPTLTISLTDLEAGQPDAPTVTRTEFSEPTNPALDVTWTAPDANGTTINGYEVQYRRKAATGEQAAAWTLYAYDDPNNPGSQISLLADTATSSQPAEPGGGRDLRGASARQHQ